MTTTAPLSITFHTSLGDLDRNSKVTVVSKGLKLKVVVSPFDNFLASGSSLDCVIVPFMDKGEPAWSGGKALGWL